MGRTVEPRHGVPTTVVGLGSAAAAGRLTGCRKKKRHGRRPAAAAKPRKQHRVRRPPFCRPACRAERTPVMGSRSSRLPRATVRLTEEYGGRQVQPVTLPARVRPGACCLTARSRWPCKTSMHSGDASRDVAAAVLATPSSLPEAASARRRLRCLPAHASRTS